MSDISNGRAPVNAALTDGAGAEPSADPRRWRALILLCAAQFMVVLDASIVNVALPSIKTALHFSESSLPWVVNAYTLTFGGFLLLGGRAADLLGRRRVFMVGLVVFSAASLAGGLAQSEAWLLVARGIQGLGAAILSPADPVDHHHDLHRGQPSATRRWASGADWPAPALPPECSLAAC